MKKKVAFMLAALLLVLLASCDLRPAPKSSSIPAASSLPVSSTAVSQPLAPPPAYPWPDANAINPLTGQARPEGMEPGQRPVAVMVATNPAGLPQRGIAQADVIYEMAAEGNTTRMMAVFADYRTLPMVGPVRATQDSFIQFALPGQYILSHINNTVYGRNLLQLLSYKTVDGIVLGSAAFYFDNERNLPRPEGNPSEYCWFTDASLLWTGMEYIDIAPTTQVPALFVFGDAPPVAGAQAHTVTLTFNGASTADFRYDEASGVYGKELLGQPQMQEDGNLLLYTNVIALEAPITVKPDGLNPEFNLLGGQGYYFTRGRMQLISWTKGNPTEPLKLFDEAGAPLQVMRGRSYIGIVPKLVGSESPVSFGVLAPAEPVSVVESIPAQSVAPESIPIEQSSVPQPVE